MEFTYADLSEKQIRLADFWCDMLLTDTRQTEYHGAIGRLDNKEYVASRDNNKRSFG